MHTKLITPKQGSNGELINNCNAALTLWRIYGEWAYECSSP